MTGRQHTWHSWAQAACCCAHLVQQGMVVDAVERLTQSPQLPSASRIEVPGQSFTQRVSCYCCPQAYQLAYSQNNAKAVDINLLRDLSRMCDDLWSCVEGDRENTAACLAPGCCTTICCNNVCQGSAGAFEQQRLRSPIQGKVPRSDVTPAEHVQPHHTPTRVRLFE
jgi:hypothetical protein